MSLNWQFTDSEKFKALTEEDSKYNDAFIWGMMRVDMGKITEKNADEWLWRYKFADTLNGQLFLGFTPTIEDVRKRIGLVCNVSTRTRKQFIAKQVRIHK